MTIETGLEGMYSPVTNRQAEFILNNNPKTINFQNVVYDETRDMFIIESTIKNK